MNFDDKKNNEFLDPSTIPSIADLKAVLEHIQYEYKLTMQELLEYQESRNLLAVKIIQNKTELEKLIRHELNKTNFYILKEEVEWFPGEDDFTELAINCKNDSELKTAFELYDEIQNKLISIKKEIESGADKEGFISLNELEKESRVYLEAINQYLNELNKRIFRNTNSAILRIHKSEERINFRERLRNSIPSDTTNPETLLDEMTANYFNVSTRTIRNDTKRANAKKGNFRK